MSISLAALIHTALTLLVCLFQLALALGAPWGQLAMGGKYPGRFPAALRVAALVQLALLALLAAVVASRAGLVLPQWQESTDWAIWFVVAVHALGTLLNLITPSRWERRLWAPVAGLMLACSLWVALAR